MHTNLFGWCGDGWLDGYLYGCVSNEVGMYVCGYITQIEGAGVGEWKRSEVFCGAPI